MMYKSTSGFPRPLLTTKAYPDMTCEAPLNLTLFRPDGVIMLADVRAQVELLLAGNARRDTLSAFNVLRPEPASTSAPRRPPRGACASSSRRSRRPRSA